MQKITEWAWKPSIKEQRRVDSFWYNPDDNWVYIARGSADKEKIYDAQWMYDNLSNTNYDNLKKHMKTTFDFLHSILGS